MSRLAEGMICVLVGIFEIRSSQLFTVVASGGSLVTTDLLGLGIFMILFGLGLGALGLHDWVRQEEPEPKTANQPPTG